MKTGTLAALFIAAGLAATAGCSTAAGSNALTSAHATCEAMLPGRDVQAWQSVTVRDLRAYQYGGPVASFPLEHAFAGAKPAQSGAWCWVRTDRNTGDLWGAVQDHGVGLAITVSGPGGQPHGVMSGPPHVP
jgi:hypothetical protein